MCGFSGRAIQVLKACRGEQACDGERAGRRGNPPRHQGIQQLAHHSPAVCEGRVHWRFGHHDGDVPERRTPAGAGNAHRLRADSLLPPGPTAASQARG
ncbi:hypothetical protein LP415_04675 [Polaromonas sp. P1(28)-8]|nr:hypothetical protein LP415_04675 [Polaromonas sp. P1(28)-8]